MQRKGAASTAAANNGTKFGEGKLLRTKHIDTLEVLDEYSQEVARLHKENKSLQQQLSKLVSARSKSSQALQRNVSAECILAC